MKAISLTLAAFFIFSTARADEVLIMRCENYAVSEVMIYGDPVSGEIAKLEYSDAHTHFLGTASGKLQSVGDRVAATETAWIRLFLTVEEAVPSRPLAVKIQSSFPIINGKFEIGVFCTIAARTLEEVHGSTGASEAARLRRRTSQQTPISIRRRHIGQHLELHLEDLT